MTQRKRRRKPITRLRKTVYAKLLHLFDFLILTFLGVFFSKREKLVYYVISTFVSKIMVLFGQN